LVALICERKKMLKNIFLRINKISKPALAIFVIIGTLFLQEIFQKPIKDIRDYIYGKEEEIFYQVDSNFNILHYGETGAFSLKTDNNKYLEKELCEISHNGFFIVTEIQKNCKMISVKAPDRPWKDKNGNYISSNSYQNENVSIKIKSNNGEHYIEHRILMWPSYEDIKISFELRLKYEREIPYRIFINQNPAPDWINCKIAHNSDGVSAKYLKQNGCEGNILIKKTLYSDEKIDIRTELYYEDTILIGTGSHVFRVSD
jgi:hypothetical protein